jgi:ABC-type nickel/cobalt efflux system permease component RcnA
MSALSWDWLIASLAALQGGALRSLAAELRAGGPGMAALAFALGALHALTPGHGKAALAAFFVGREARIVKGVRVALTAALLHVLSGFVAFLVLRIVLQQIPTMTARGSPVFTALGYGLIVVAGAILLWQSVRAPHDHHDGTAALTAGVGLLPCPLTISVLGFAWLQGHPVTVGVMLVCLALGIGFTIGLVAVLAILARRLLGLAVHQWAHRLERGARWIQGAAGLLIIAIGIAMLLSLR